MNDELNAISPDRRRRMAVALAPLGLVLLIAGGLVISLDGVGWKLAGLLIAALAVGLLAIAWGLRRSAALSEAAEAERQLDEVLTAAAGSAGSTCGSGAAAEGAACGAAGPLCGSSAEGGCGAACLTRTR